MKKSNLKESNPKESNFETPPMETSKMELSVIIPAYNEEKRIETTLQKIVFYLKQNKNIKNYEIIVVDDGSKDHTREIVEKYLLSENFIKLNSFRENRGKGFSVREGALLAQYSLILFSDADLSTPIEELDKFLPLIANYDIIIGSRALKESDVKKHQPFYREIMGKTFNFLMRKITGLPFKDTQCGFKLFKNCRVIFQNQVLERFSFDVELLYLALKDNKKVAEIPVSWINDERSKVSPITDSLQMFKDILKIKSLHKNENDFSKPLGDGVEK